MVGIASDVDYRRRRTSTEGISDWMAHEMPQFRQA